MGGCWHKLKKPEGKPGNSASQEAVCRNLLREIGWGGAAA